MPISPHRQPAFSDTERSSQGPDDDAYVTGGLFDDVYRAISGSGRQMPSWLGSLRFVAVSTGGRLTVRRCGASTASTFELQQ